MTTTQGSSAVKRVSGGALMLLGVALIGFRDHDAERDQGDLTAVFNGSAP